MTILVASNYMIVADSAVWQNNTISSYYCKVVSHPEGLGFAAIGEHVKCRELQRHFLNAPAPLAGFSTMQGYGFVVDFVNQEKYIYSDGDLILSDNEIDIAGPAVELILGAYYAGMHSPRNLVNLAINCHDSAGGSIMVVNENGVREEAPWPVHAS